MQLKENEHSPGHKMPNVYREMLWQICRFYTSGLPDVRSIRMVEIRFFYEGLRPELKRHTGG